MRRTFLLQAFVALFFAIALPNAQAVPVAGKDYVALSAAQPVETGDKIEVLEVFSYMCPHCFHFEPQLSAWIKTLPADVVVRRLPVTFNRENWTNLTKLYYTLEIMNELGKLHGKVFDAIHEQKVDLSNSDVLFDWVAKQGIDRKKFTDTFNSFTVQTKVSRVPQLTRNYGIESVPTLIVDGKYRLISSVSGHEALFRNTDELIALARSQRPAKAAASETSSTTTVKSSADQKKKATTQ
jgi:thiol:disulfide interchange protein DsbA